jgi:hypothetical protein
MRAFLLRATPLIVLLAAGLFASGPSASGQEAVGARPIERAPTVEVPYSQSHVDLHPLTPLTPTGPLSAPIGNAPSCCGGTSTGSEPGASDAGAAASPAENDDLAGSVVDTMMEELPIVGKQRSAE